MVCPEVDAPANCQGYLGWFGLRYGLPAYLVLWDLLEPGVVCAVGIAVPE